MWLILSGAIGSGWQNVLLSVRTNRSDELRLFDVQNIVKQYLCVCKYTYVLIFEAVCDFMEYCRRSRVASAIQQGHVYPSETETHGLSSCQ